MGYLKIFQVGGTIVPLFQQKLLNSYNSKSEGDETELISSINPLVRDTQFIHKTRDMKISGYILDIAQTKAEWVEQMLRSYVGKPLPIIAYQLHGSHIEEYSQCCDCAKSKKCCLSFYQAIGIIEQVDDLKEGDWGEPLELSFSIKLVSHWRGLDKLLWRWGSYAITSANTPIELSHYDIDCIDDFPSCAEMFASCKDCDKGFFPVEFATTEYIFDPFYLQRRVCGSDCNEFSVCCLGDIGQVFSAIVSGGKYTLTKLKQREWGIPPLSIYVFEGIGSGQIKIGTRGNDGGIRSISRDTTIDIDVTNTILNDNGYASLDRNDKIIVGDFSVAVDDKMIRKAGIVRDGEFLSIQPIVIYPDYFPAMIYPSDNASFFATGDFTHYTAAHYFRKA